MIVLARLSGVPAGDLAVSAQPPGQVAALAQRPDVKAALELPATTEPQTIADQIRFCEVPAPPFKETARGEVLRRAFDAGWPAERAGRRAGNVLGDRPGAAARPRLVIAAHLDTVFPAETNVKVSRSGPVLRGPGIGDNCRGLAVLVAIARALDAGARPNRRPHHVRRPTSARKDSAISAG